MTATNNTVNKPSIQWGKIALILVLFCGGGFLLLVDIAPVVLSWETASEVGTAGFNVYRADVSNETTDDPSIEQFLRVNEELIPAEGDEVLGATYRYEDYAVTPIKRYLYRIEEVEWDGARQLYPETVAVRAGLTRMWRQLEGSALCVLAILMAWWGYRNK